MAKGNGARLWMKNFSDVINKSNVSESIFRALALLFFDYRNYNSFVLLLIYVRIYNMPEIFIFVLRYGQSDDVYLDIS